MPDRIIELYDRTALAWDAARGQTLGAERVQMDRLTAGIPIGGTILTSVAALETRLRACFYSKAFGLPA